MTSRYLIYNVMALVTIMVWGITFVSTKILITYGLSPVEIFIIRFAIAYLCTLIFCHDRLWAKSIKDESLMLTAGITGGSLYFIVENTALSITFVSNVSLIICCAISFVDWISYYIYWCSNCCAKWLTPIRREPDW